MSEAINIFEAAVRGKYRFPYKGLVSVEDLWDLPLTALDTIFKSLNAVAKESKEESLLADKTKEDTELDDKIQIIRYIVATKQQEIADRKDAAAKKAAKQRLLEIKAAREDKRLESVSDEELDRMIAELA